MYVASIRPILEFGDKVWDTCSQELENDTEAVLLAAARMNGNSYRGVERNIDQQPYAI